MLPLFSPPSAPSIVRSHTYASGATSNFAYDGLSRRISIIEKNSSGTVTKEPIDGGTSVQLAGGQSGPRAIAVDSTSVYWTEQGTPSGAGETVGGAVMKVGLDGTGLTTVAACQNWPYAIAVDATSVYWTDTSGGNVYRTAK